MTRRDDLDWNAVRSFLAVAREGSLSEAARRLGVRHTTVGRRVAALEHALGETLILRRPEGVALTDFGRRLLAAGDDLDVALDRFRDVARARPTRVRLALPSGYPALLAPALLSLKKSAPRLELDLISGSRPVDLKRGEAELALRVGAVADEALTVTRLCDAGWSLYAAEAYLARRPWNGDPTDLAGHEIVGLDARLAGVVGAVWVAAHGEGAKIALRLSEMTEVLNAVVAGVGIGALPCLLGDAEPRLRRLAPDVIGRQPVSLVYRADVGRSAPVRAVVRFVAAVVKRHAAAIEGRV